MERWVPTFEAAAILDNEVKDKNIQERATLKHLVKKNY